MFGAATLPLRFRFLHPVMLLLAVLWIVSPLGGQAALRIVGITSRKIDHDGKFTYLDTYNSDFYGGGQNAWRTAVISSFNAALGSPTTTKTAGQDIYGNLKIPMLEPLLADKTANDEGWYDIDPEADVGPESDFWYSSLTGLPMTDGLPSEGKSVFDLESWYAYANCSVVPKARQSPPDMWTALPGYEIFYNNLSLTFMLKDPRVGSAKNDEPFTFFMLSGAVKGTNATCTVRPTRVDTRVGCTGRVCEAMAVRQSANAASKTTPGLRSNLLEVISSLSMASRVGYDTLDDWIPSPLEKYFVNPSYPFTGENEQVDLLISDASYSRRFTQLLNTCWVASFSPSLALGRPLADTDQAKVSTKMSLSQGTITTEQDVIACNYVWFWILVVSSIVMLSAGASSIIIDFIRRGPDVLDGLSLALRENAFVRFPTGSSMDDGDDLARRFKKVKVRLGDVQLQKDIGHVAIGTPVPDQPVGRLVEGRFYV